MSTTAPTFDRLARLPPPLILLGLLGGAAIAGGVAAIEPRLGVAAVGGLVFLAFVLLDLPVAVGIWIVALYIAGAPGTHGAVTGTSVVLLAGWAGTFADRLPHIRTAVWRVRWALLLTALMIVWSTLSYLWSTDTSATVEVLKGWYVAAGVLPVLVTAVTRTRDIVVVLGWFVAGATLAVVLALATGSTANVSEVASLDPGEGRLTIGITDPNYLAADIVGALAIVTGLLAVRMHRLWRVALLASVPVLIYGLVATQSRGGIIAAGVMMVCAVVVLRGYRARIVAALLVALVLFGAFLAVQPRALDRLTGDRDSTGTGRTDVWRVAVEVVESNPVVGVGTGNFVVVEHRYAQDAVGLKSLAMIVDKPLVTHNVWLQALTENGAIGLLLLIGSFGSCIGSSLLASRRWRRQGRKDLGHMAAAVFVGQIGALAASTFIANGNDRVWWVLLALGPGMLAVAAVRTRSPQDDEDDAPVATRRGPWPAPARGGTGLRG